jgi:hypothetical protein
MKCYGRDRAGLQLQFLKIILTTNGHELTRIQTRRECPSKIRENFPLSPFGAERGKRDECGEGMLFGSVQAVQKTARHNRPRARNQLVFAGFTWLARALHYGTKN